ncbi:hypothetical protein AB0F43_24950 [Kribbella sp. NPDC023972]
MRADAEAKLLLTRYLPGELVRGVRDEDFERQGHRMIAEVLGET